MDIVGNGIRIVQIQKYVWRTQYRFSFLPGIQSSHNGCVNDDYWRSFVGLFFQMEYGVYGCRIFLIGYCFTSDVLC